MKISNEVKAAMIVAFLFVAIVGMIISPVAYAVVSILLTVLLIAVTTYLVYGGIVLDILKGEF